MEEGRDPRGLGRWVWTRYRGAADLKLRVVIGYRPVLNSQGQLSVWTQQKEQLERNGVDTCPQKMFLIDLLNAVKEWMEKGDQIVLAMDANDDVQFNPIRAAMQAVGLSEVITTLHDPDKTVAPRTYERGSRPIDGLFVTPSLLSARCGYLPFVLDHRCLWIDIPMDIVFGQEGVDKVPKQR